MQHFLLSFREPFKSVPLFSGPLEGCLHFPRPPLLSSRKQPKSATHPVRLLGWLPLNLACSSFVCWQHLRFLTAPFWEDPETCVRFSQPDHLCFVWNCARHASFFPWLPDPQYPCEQRKRSYHDVARAPKRNFVPLIVLQERDGTCIGTLGSGTCIGTAASSQGCTSTGIPFAGRPRGLHSMLAITSWGGGGLNKGRLLRWRRPLDR